MVHGCLHDGEAIHERQLAKSILAEVRVGNQDKDADQLQIWVILPHCVCGSCVRIHRFIVSYFHDGFIWL